MKNYKTNTYLVPSNSNSSWILLPLFYIAVTYLMCYHTNNVFKYVPDCMWLNSINQTNLVGQTVSTYLPKLPTDPATVIQLYDLKLNQQTNSNMLEEASKITNFKFESVDQFDMLISELKTTRYDNSGGMIGKFWRMITVVNVIWIISTLGMIITFFPAIVKILGPLMQVLTEILLEILTFALKYYEEIGYGFLSFLLTQSFKMHKDIGFFIGFTSLAGYYALFLHSAKIHEKSSELTEDTKKIFVFTMMLAPTVMMTVYHASYFLGFVSVMFFYGMIGFSVISRGLCWGIGFNSEDSLTNCVGASLTMVPLYFVFNKVSGSMQYFSYGVYVFGVIVYLLGLLILSSSFHTKGADYARCQILMIASLVGLMITGSYSNILSLFNVSVTFACLYFGEKVGEMSLWKGNEIVLTFALFLSTYFGSLWLSTHPEFITSVLHG